MDGFGGEAILAIFLGMFLLPFAFIPYVAWSFRRGTTGPGHAFLSFGALIYLLALWTYTILPLPDPDSLVCGDGLTAQFIPFAFLGEIDWGAGPLAILAGPVVRQVALNILFFVPLGVFARHLLGLRPATTILAGFGVSLLIELTQLTGDWGVYPCAYRLFDVDDLLANTAGAALGVLLAPLARYFPGQHTRDADLPSPVRPMRRILSMAVDALSVFLIAYGLPLALQLLTGVDDASPLFRIFSASSILVTALVLLLLVPAVFGSTLGHRLTFLRAVRPDGGEPGLWRWILRFLGGAGGYFMLLALEQYLDLPLAGFLAQAWLIASLLAVVIAHTRGLSGYASGLVVIDSREPDTAKATRQRGADPRKMSSAVLVLVAAMYLGMALLVSLSQTIPQLATGIVLVVYLVIAAGSLILVAYLVFNAVVVVRREGRSLSGMLGLLAVVAVFALLILLGLAVALQWRWMIALGVAGVALTAYLGFVFGAFLLYGQIYARVPARPGMDAIIVLGSRVFGDRVPPLLASRIDLGLKIQREELEAGREPMLVLSGGQGDDEVAPEGEVMAKYAVEHGADPALVRAETAATNTRENLELSRALLDAEGLGPRMVVTTNDYHAFRAGLLARRLGMDAQVVGSPTAHYYFPSAVLREFAGVLWLGKWAHLLLGLGIVALTGGMTAIVLGLF
ncbi:ElyC/SanA/YdcF family protein [Gulosibacter sp. 10]|uniref:ElyC/SanA/YdcF family protein n=1 Tax=Gulosibacter sp. 10 TaxID=1255570 RepID=UPI00097EDA56|nr:ElyC/SanA/YdcF family protein [Gulosibacter sp. 10]SJM59147.1 hypothetical protein FM112_06325 [Gulosibacter sp. 10]